jgi:hypothetical protein
MCLHIALAVDVLVPPILFSQIQVPALLNLPIKPSELPYPVIEKLPNCKVPANVPVA